MEKIGLIADMTDAVRLINKGRRGLSTKGKTEDGLQNFVDGHAHAERLMKAAIVTGDPEMMLILPCSSWLLQRC